VNLAICHPVIVPARGGCETYVADLIRRLSGDGHTVHLYASTWDAAALPANLHIHHIPETGWPRCLRPWRFSRACQEALRKNTHDLSIGFDKVAGVDVFYPQGGLHIAAVRQAMLKFRNPLHRALAIALRAIDPAHCSFSRFERRQYRVERGERSELRLADTRQGRSLRARHPFIIVNSDFVRRHFHDYLGVPPSRVAVLHCAIDPDRFTATDRPARRAATRQLWDIEPNDTVALFVAMNYRLKGLEPLLHAVSRIPDRSRFRLAVIGRPETAAFERLAKRLGITECVRFLGFMPDPRNAYFAADLLVHPTFYDPCSLVVQEALACGLPVITSRHNGASELLDPPHDGLVIRDPHDSEELAGALTTWLDPSRRQAGARAALRAAQKWTFADHYRQLLKLLEEAARRKRAA
jgi:UDP-glucose:(heptosyl)LPS alpha-1,3-glucosyltransferase